MKHNCSQQCTSTRSTPSEADNAVAVDGELSFVRMVQALLGLERLVSELHQ